MKTPIAVAHPASDKIVQSHAQICFRVAPRFVALRRSMEAGGFPGSPLADIVGLLQMAHNFALRPRALPFFTRHPAASPCQVPGPPPPASASRSRLHVSSTVGSRPRPCRHKLSSSDRIPTSRPPSCGRSTRSSCRSQTASTQWQSPRPRTASSSWRPPSDGSRMPEKLRSIWTIFAGTELRVYCRSTMRPHTVVLPTPIVGLVADVIQKSGRAATETLSPTVALRFSTNGSLRLTTIIKRHQPRASAVQRTAGTLPFAGLPISTSRLFLSNAPRTPVPVTMPRSARATELFSTTKSTKPGVSAILPPPISI